MTTSVASAHDQGRHGRSLGYDCAIRLWAAESVVAGAGVAIIGSLAGIAAMTGMRLADADHAPGTLSVAMWPDLASAFAAGRLSARSG